MQSQWRFERRTVIAAPAQAVWARVVTPEGINDELRPWMTMSVPRGAEGVTIDDLDVGVPLGRAWLRLFGVLPFDYDHLTITELEPGKRFREESVMLSMSRWVHERTVDSVEDGTSVVDRIMFAPRRHLILLGPVLARVLSAFFAHRHRRLARHFSP
jgi:ligand-binding SRPBCC domain-containing protein